MRSFRYILRYQIDPGFHEDDRIRELAAFCSASAIEEVMLFVTPEELSPGHPTDDEVEQYIAVGKKLKRALDRARIALSLNPWTTTYHVSRGRRMRQGQSFNRMVGETGAVSPISACPLCPDWQAWICRIFSRLSAELQPTVLWVEDDWRLHNHEADMRWGGCFCPLHMERFSAMVAQPVDRQQLIEAVLQPGTPHPWRDLWLNLWRDTLIEPAERLRQAISAASPDTQLGLMSSVPDIHSIEGRDWHAMQQALGSEPAFLTRPHLPPYTATRALNTTPAVTRQTIANLKRPIEVYPELENSPRSGQYSKSHTYSAWECLHAAAYGSHGITINHYDMMGNGIALDPGFGKKLKAIKPTLNAITSLGIDDDQAQGLQILFSPDIGRSIHADGAASFQHLHNHSDTWSHAAYILGISHRFTTQVQHTGEPMAVSGQTLRAFSDDDLRQLLSGPVLLDGMSVEVILQRGLGEFIGISSANWQTLDDTGYAYERIDSPHVDRYGLANPRMSAQRCALRLLAMQPHEPADVRTTILTASHQPLFPGLVVHRNALGGVVASLAYPFDGQHQFYMGFFNVFRRTLMQDLLFDMAPDAPLAAISNHPLHLYRAQTSAGVFLSLLNPLHDSAHQPILRLPKHSIDPANLKQLSEFGKWKKCPAQWNDDGRCLWITLPGTIDPLQACTLLAPG